MAKATCKACGRTLNQLKGSYGSWEGRGGVERKGRPCRPNHCAEQGINPNEKEHVQRREECFRICRVMMADLGKGWSPRVFYNLGWCFSIVYGRDPVTGDGISVSVNLNAPSATSFHAHVRNWHCDGRSPGAALKQLQKVVEADLRMLGDLAGRIRTSRVSP